VAFINGNKSIVIDGLVFLVDAANKQSYIGSGTTCNALIGNTTGSLQGTGIFEDTNGGVFAMDGATEYIQFQPYSGFNFGTNLWTVGIWVYPTGGASAYTPLWVIAGYSSSNGFALYRRTNDTLHLYKAAENDQTSITLSLNEWNYIVTTRKSSTEADFYIFNSTNGLQTETETISSGGNWGNSTLNSYFGKTNTSSGDQYYGKIGPYQVYNRSLSSNEITQNYNALKSRFE
jgi:hypothetical protein